LILFVLRRLERQWQLLRRRPRLGLQSLLQPLLFLLRAPLRLPPGLLRPRDQSARRRSNNAAGAARTAHWTKRQWCRSDVEQPQSARVAENSKHAEIE